MKKVLIITYYWPPAGGPGVQRVLKFAKHLPAFGWQPIILTVAKGEFPVMDNSLEKDVSRECIVFKTNSLEPTLLYKKFVGLKKEDPIPIAVITEKNKNWKKKLSNWIRINFFIPDAKIFWKYYAVKEGKKIIKTYKPDLIISSSPPPTVHLIAKTLKEKFGIPWISDFRDPWTDIYHFDNIKKNKVTRFVETNLEKNVLAASDLVVTVSNHFKKIFSQKINNDVKIKVITNGFDQDDFNIKPNRKTQYFTIAYSGKLSEQQNPVNLWKSIKVLIENNPESTEKIKFMITGKIADGVFSSLKSFNLEHIIINNGYLPHRDSISKIIDADILLLVSPDTKQNKGILPGKIFEYMATGNFVLAIGPTDGDIAHILKESKAGEIFSFNHDLSTIIQELYVNWEKRLDSNKTNKTIIKKYNRYELTKSLAAEMDRLI